MSDGFESGRQVFLEEAREIIGELESALLQMEESPEDAEPVGRVFRAMHTLKGSGAMFGFDDVASFTHEIETVYDLVRSGTLPVTRALLDLTFESVDQIATMFQAYSSGGIPDMSGSEVIVASFRKLAGEAPPAKLADSHPQPPQQTTMNARDLTGQKDIVTYEIRFRPSPDIMLSGTNPFSLIDQVAALGDCGVTADTTAVPLIEDIDPEKCYTGWYLLLSTKHCIEEVREVFIFVEDESELSIKRIEGLCVMDGKFGHKLIGDLLVERGEVRPEALKAALSKKKRLGELLLEMGELTDDGLNIALAEQKVLDTRWKEKSSESVKVASDKLDVLADLVGEMVTVQARLKRASALLGNAELQGVTEQMFKLTEMLRDNTLSMRMVPFGSTFTKYKRLVRDLSRSLGKDVDFSTKGGETELDKTVLERLGDPIMHLIRNCIDHGIEPAGERVRLGKCRKGSVQLEAAHVGGKVVVRVTDDGRGLDEERIRRVAVARGLLARDAMLSGPELFALTLEPGFTTADSVSTVSGRGVGMDIVKRSVDSLRGTVEISSVSGTGTTITLTLPLTLAIIEGLLVSIGQAAYIIPLNMKSEVMERSSRDVTLGGIGEFIDVRGELVPCIRLRDFFRLAGAVPEMEHVVVVEDDTGKTGLVVDEVVGEHQAVVKPLSRVCSSGEGISGATILGDGGIALILDVTEIIKASRADIKRMGLAA